MCRKNSVPCANDETPSGSPPRVREKLFVICNTSIVLRITPACAGKTIESNFRLCLYWDHPRVCGKNHESLELSLSRSGSPPRVREKLLSDMIFLPFFRITPACAGKTRNHQTSSRALQDHPRVCGKNKNVYRLFKLS